MNNEQKYELMDHATEPVCPEEYRGPKKRRKRMNPFKKFVALVLSAAFFGGVSSGVFYGVNTFLGNTVAQESVAVETRTASLSTVSYTSGQSLDVTAVATLGLSSVVSVTNISVQEVENYFGQFGPGGRGQMQLQETTSCGSGVIIYADDSDLYIVTNYHVVEDATTLSVTFVDDETYEAELCGYDESMDIAVLKVSFANLSSDTAAQISVVAIGDSEKLAVGEQVVAIGNALGYGQSVTTGIVSALNRTVSTDTGSSTYIQTDAAINPGNSGGALFNMSGELIGINTAKVSSTEVEGMGYAIPISHVLELIESLMSEGSM